MVVVWTKKGSTRTHLGAVDFTVGDCGQLYILWPDYCARSVHAPGEWLHAAVKPDAETSG